MINNTRNFTPSKKVSFKLPDTSSLSYRFSQRSDMEFRIWAEMKKRVHDGYSVYFFTLTYNPENRPYFAYGKNKKCACFSRDDIRYFIRGIQKELNRLYKISDISYVIASEYGKSGEFCPHYHGAIMLPSMYQDKDGFRFLLTAKKVHQLIIKWWSNSIGWKKDIFERESKGFVLPRKWNGGKDSHGYEHKPLQVDFSNVSAFERTAKYIAKYCCKQIGFYEDKNTKDVLKALKYCKDLSRLKQWRKCKPFVKTSLGFGSCIEDLVLNNDVDWFGHVDGDANEKLYNGIKCNLCTKHKVSIPVYNKKRLLWQNELYDVQEIDMPMPNYKGKLGQTIFDDFEKFQRFGDVEPQHKKKYIYNRVMTDFAKEYIPFEYQNKVIDYEKLINEFKFVVGTPQFKDFMSCGGVLDDNYYYRFCDSVLNCNAHNISVYKYAFKDKVNPFHFAHWLKNKDSYYDALMEYENGRIEFYWKYAPEGAKPFKLLKNYSIREIKAKEIYGVLHNDDWFIYDDSEDNNTVFRYPLFFGNEDINKMCDSALDFVCCDLDVVCSPLNEDYVPENLPSCIFFNDFSCFCGFDNIILWLDSFRAYQRDIDLMSRVNKDRIKKSYIDKVFNDKYI